MTTPANPLVFPLTPDWSRGVRERLIFPSSVIESHAGHEQRATLVSRPRVELSFTAVAADAVEASLAETLLLQASSRIVAVPRYTDQVALRQPAPAGAMSLTLTTIVDFEPNFESAPIVICLPGCRGVLAKVAAASGYVLTLEAPLSAAAPAGSVVAPALFSRISSSFSAERSSDNYAEWTLTFSEAL